DPGDILQAQDAGRLQITAGGPDLEDDVFKLLFLDQAALGGDGELKALPLSGRRLPDLPGRHLDVLLLDGADDVADTQVARGQLVRVQPDAHAVIALANVGHVTHPLEPRQLIPNLNGGVI